MGHYRIALLFLLPAMCAVADESSQLTALRNEIQQIKLNQEEMTKTLQVIKDLLMGSRPLGSQVVRISDSPALGEPTATVTIVEFSDFQCPYCGTYARETFDNLVAQYVKTGKVRYVIRNFPIEQIHPFAEKAAEAAMCAKEQGKYWEAHRLFFDNQQALDEVIRLQKDDAARVGVDTAVFSQCIASKKYVSLIQRDLADGLQLGVKGTPTFFLGYADEKDRSNIKAVKSLVGAPPANEFYAVIEDLLKKNDRGVAITVK